MAADGDMFFYLKGYVFLRIRTGLEGRDGAQLFLELWPEENIRAKAKELGIDEKKSILHDEESKFSALRLNEFYEVIKGCRSYNIVSSQTFAGRVDTLF